MATDGTRQHGTKWPELFAALAAPFTAAEEKQRKSEGGKQVRYITARSVLNRLDDVMGPEGWWDDYTTMEHGVVCRLSLSLPDGQVITKVDAGGYAGMADEGNDEKSGFSDALKRAAVRWGIGRYLYRDGTPDYGGDHPVNGHAPTASNGAGEHHRSSNVSNSNPPRTGKALFARLKDLEKEHSTSFIKPLNDHARGQGWADKIVDYQDDEVRDAWEWVEGMLPGQSAPASKPAPRQQAQPDVSALRSEFVSKVREIDAKVHDDPNWSDPKTLKDEVNRIAHIASPGWKIITLKDLTDPEAFRKLIDAAREREAEVLDIPF